jgi:hypothetical protein
MMEAQEATRSHFSPNRAVSGPPSGTKSRALSIRTAEYMPTSTGPAPKWLIK